MNSVCQRWVGWVVFSWNFSAVLMPMVERIRAGQSSGEQFFGKKETEVRRVKTDRKVDPPLYVCPTFELADVHLTAQGRRKHTHFFAVRYSGNRLTSLSAFLFLAACNAAHAEVRFPPSMTVGRQSITPYNSRSCCGTGSAISQCTVMGTSPSQPANCTGPA